MIKNTIAIANFKGGVGKTTTAVNLASILAIRGHKTLLIDSDAQCNATSSIGYQVGQSVSTLDDHYKYLRDKGSIKKSFTYQVAENLYIIPGSLELSLAAENYNAVSMREFMLKRVVEAIEEDFDYCIIDCPPAMDILTKNVLAVSNWVIVPCMAETLAAQGLELFVNSVDRYIIQSGVNQGLDMLGILLTRYNGTTVISKNLKEMIEEKYQGRLFDTHIRPRVAFTEAQALGQPITTYAEDNAGAVDYARLAVEIEERIEQDLIIEPQTEF